MFNEYYDKPLKYSYEEFISSTRRSTGFRPRQQPQEAVDRDVINYVGRPLFIWKNLSSVPLHEKALDGR